MVFATPCYSQILTSDVLSTRLCKTWKIDKIVQGEKVALSESLISDFVLIIHPNHSVEQGMSPDGLIPGTWLLDEQNRILTVKDNETGSLYPMKIIAITPDALILQDQSAPVPLTIYYRAN
jgi:hypothetical protein